MHAKRPGMELVVAAHKSVALLGLVGRADDMHAILDTETEATLAYLDAWMIARGGRRGRSQTRVPTNGLVSQRTRHATSRAGDPEPHDHILIDNLCRISDDKGGWKSLDTAALRDILHAATAFGRVASAAKAVELGYAIEPDDGPSGRLGHWRIAGMPERACELFSKRSAEVAAAVEHQGYDTYQARQVAARSSRKAKRHTPPADLMAGWLPGGGRRPDGLLEGVEKAAAGRRPRRAGGAHPAPVVSPGRLPARPVRAPRRPKGVRPRRRRCRRRAAAVRLRPPRAPPCNGGRLRSPRRRPADGCEGGPGAGLRPRLCHRQRGRHRPQGGPSGRAPGRSRGSSARRGGRPGGKGTRAGRPLAHRWPEGDGAGVATSGRGVELVVGMAGAGKSTALDASRRAFEAAGFKVLGTAVSGQAARTLGTEAGIDEPAPSRLCCGGSTMASSRWTTVLSCGATRRAWPTTPPCSGCSPPPRPPGQNW